MYYICIINNKEMKKIKKESIVFTVRCNPLLKKKMIKKAYSQKTTLNALVVSCLMENVAVND